jgi:DNA-binding NarL/FixJ family response regulator
VQPPIALILIFAKTMASDLLREAFAHDARFKVLGQATTEQQVTNLLNAHPADVALIDGDLGNGSQSSIDLLCQVRRISPSVKPIMLIEERDAQKTIDCFRNGAKGVFPKSGAEFKLLCKCVECVYQGQIWASSEELCWLLSALESSVFSPSALRVVDVRGERLLSNREEDVVKLLMEGYSNREIAQGLDLSEHTIKNYLFRIFEKLGVSSRTELLLYAMNSMSAEVPPSERKSVKKALIGADEGKADRSKEVVARRQPGSETTLWAGQSKKGQRIY